ncbi:MAG: hypothetical protein A2X08_09310 [Bacteroidetes bacterium GWA2_32_17]|nr:MAG: hypothetical protein A2X08_09310 [Bacteroidetes bacterium GWA2_32_17]
MKKIITFLIILISFTFAKGQSYQYCTGFETPDLFITIDSLGIWKIGHPSKIVFNTNIEGNKSIMTDTLNPYPINDTSSFEITMHLIGFMAEVNFFDIELTHRFDTDSLLDNCLIDLSIDGRISWFNVLSDTLSLYPNSHYFYSLGTYINGYLPISGNSQDWVVSTFRKDIWQNWSIPNIDSVIIKFTFISDSIQTNKDGWQIDYLCLTETHYGTIKELSSLNNFANIFPNPAYQELTFIFDNSFHQPFNLTIENAYGKNVFQKLNNTTGIIELINVSLKPSIYFYKLSTNGIIKGIGKIVIN